jgi:hypothetical protein
MMRTVATVVWRDGPRATLPEALEELERLAPLPMSRVAGEMWAIEALRDEPSVADVSILDGDKASIVAGLAKIVGRFDFLSQRSLNGYPLRVPAAAVAPAYPIVPGSVGELYRFDEALTRINPMAYPAAVNLSLAGPTWLGDELNPTDPLAIAVAHAAARAPVVVPVGNNGEEPYADTRSALAKLPTTISVGAAADEQGDELMALSSTAPEDVPGPFVCAYGWSEHQQPQPGTSFAVPRVSDQLAVLTAFLLTVRRALVPDEDVEGIPLSALGFVDEGALTHADSRYPLPAYPLGAGIDVAAVREAERIARGAVDFSAAPAGVLRALARSARPMAGGAHRVGHGFVSDDTTAAYLERFDGRELIALLGGAGAAPPDDAALRVPLAARDLDEALAIWARGAVWLWWDYRTGTYAEA